LDDKPLLRQLWRATSHNVTLRSSVVFDLQKEFVFSAPKGVPSDCPGDAKSETLDLNNGDAGGVDARSGQRHPIIFSASSPSEILSQADSWRTLCNRNQTWRDRLERTPSRSH